MPQHDISRRDFLKQNSIAGAGIIVAGISPSVFSNINTGKPALLGGKRIVNTSWTKWPMWIPESDEKLVLDTIRSGVWSRDKVVTEFEK